MNCRNGYPGICMGNHQPAKPKPANLCNECDAPIPPRHRYCPKCKKLHRKQTFRAANGKRISAKPDYNS